MIEKILKTDPTERYTIEDIRAHTWYKQVNTRDYGGIIVGMQPIPVDVEVVDMLTEHKFDLLQARKYIENNRHNSVTTTYYLLLKRYIRQGNKSIADITKYNPKNI